MKKYLISLMLTGLIFFVQQSCEKEKNSFKTAEGYIIGSFRCDETDGQNGLATGESTPQGFVIVFENGNDSLYTFSLSENLFDFPSDILAQGANVNNCGPIYFSNKKEYKIKFKYKDPNDSEMVYFTCFCYDYLIPYNWNSINQVIIEDVVKI